MADPKPLAEEIERIVFAFPAGDSRRDDVRELAQRVAAIEAEKAEREAIERRRDEWLGTGSKYGIKRRWIEQCQTESGFLIALCSHEAMKYFRDIGEGPTYHGALAEALGKAEKT